MSTETSTSTPALASTCAVLLGASNLSLGWPRLADQIGRTLPTPLEVFTAHGMGRSYCGERSGFACWQLPGILKCDLWNDLPTFTSISSTSFALITDLGNDLVYGKTPLQIEEAARECVERLRKWQPDCRISMTRPPVESIETVGWLRYAICRWILFAGCPLTLPEVKSATVELDDRLTVLAGELDVEIYKPKRNWYGLDPIHVKRKHQATAFATMTQGWQPSANTTAGRSNFRRRPRAKIRWIWGRRKLVDQPSVQNACAKVFAY